MPVRSDPPAVFLVAPVLCVGAVSLSPVSGTSPSHCVSCWSCGCSAAVLKVARLKAGAEAGRGGGEGTNGRVGGAVWGGGWA